MQPADSSAPGRVRLPLTAASGVGGRRRAELPREGVGGRAGNRSLHARGTCPPPTHGAFSGKPPDNATPSLQHDEHGKELSREFKWQP